MRISYLVTASSLIALTACGGGEADTPQDTASTDTPEAVSSSAPVTAEIDDTPVVVNEPESEPAPTPEPASDGENKYFIPGAIYGLTEAACTNMGGRYGQTLFEGERSPHWCQLQGSGSYICGDGLIVTIGGIPGKFGMHLSGEDTFHPINLENGDGMALWGGEVGTLAISHDRTQISFESNNTQSSCKKYVYE